MWFLLKLKNKQIKWKSTVSKTTTSYFQVFPYSQEIVTAGNSARLADFYTGALPEATPRGLVSPPNTTNTVL